MQLKLLFYGTKISILSSITWLIINSLEKLFDTTRYINLWQRQKVVSNGMAMSNFLYKYEGDVAQMKELYSILQVP